MLLKWFPWRWLVRGMARAHGLLDPLNILARLEHLAQPSEVAAPIELLRLGLALHARGVINSKVVQQNLDWSWPFWIQRQFHPDNAAFVPRAFGSAQLNLCHRNWTAVGVPGCEAMPVVDPRGLVTPFFDGWSLDAWIVPDEGPPLLPPQVKTCRQELRIGEDELAVQTRIESPGMTLRSLVRVEAGAGQAVCRVRYEARSERAGRLVLSLRPFNPEGVGLVERIELHKDRAGWEVDGRGEVLFDRPAERHVCSTYHEGDVAIGLADRAERRSCRCKVGLATAAAMFPLPAEEDTSIEAAVDLSGDRTVRELLPRGRAEPWRSALHGSAKLDVPDAQFVFLYDAAVRTLLLLSPRDVYPGPYTYKRFWFRDAVLILHAMLCANLPDPVAGSMERFPRRQRLSGYFHSQSGEWDSNGQVLWLLRRYRDLTGRALPQNWQGSMRRAGRWIRRKLTSPDGDDPHAGLLPAGFSAEHLGTNDYYYWDDFWSIAGLEAAAPLLAGKGAERKAQSFRDTAAGLRAAVDRSLERAGHARTNGCIPASPYRRMDSGAVGSVAGSYPAAVLAPRDPRMLGTLDYLLVNCMIDDLLFLDMNHSGQNAYLTLSVAQALLRAGDERFLSLVEGVARVASPTGQWPEAVHPATGGGCMGDGQHAWAAAEWIMMMRNMFVREEGDGLVLCSGVPGQWLREERGVSFGPAPTPHGPVSVRAERDGDAVVVSWEADWRDDAPPIKVRIAGQSVHVHGEGPDSVRIELGEKGSGA